MVALEEAVQRITYFHLVIGELNSFLFRKRISIGQENTDKWSIFIDGSLHPQFSYTNPIEAVKKAFELYEERSNAD